MLCLSGDWNAIRLFSWPPPPAGDPSALQRLSVSRFLHLEFFGDQTKERHHFGILLFGQQIDLQVQMAAPFRHAGLPVAGDQQENAYTKLSAEKERVLIKC